MPAPADGILGDIAFRRKRARYAVEAFTLCGDVEAHAVESFDKLLIGLHGAYLSFVFEHAQDVSIHVSLKRLDTAECRSEFITDGKRLKPEGGEVHAEHIALLFDRKPSAERIKADDRAVGLDKIQDNIRRCKRRVAAQLDLAAGSEPAQAVAAAVLYAESCFREIVLDGDLLHQLVVEPLVHYAHRRRISGKYLVGERIYNILLHVNYLLVFVILL